MAKIIAKFDTVPVNSKMDPEGGYTLKLKDRPIYDEHQVFEEVVKEQTLPLSKDMLEFAFLSVLKTMALKVSRDCNPRRVGNYLKFTPTLRGKLQGPYSGFNPDTCSSAIVVTSLSGLEKEVDSSCVTFVNSHPGLKVTISHLAYVGSDVDLVIKRNWPFVATGNHLEHISGKDTVEASWKTASGQDVTALLVPSEADVSHMKFDWPSALDEVPDGTSITFTFNTRGGISDADPQTNVKEVMLLAGDSPTPPGPVTPAPTLTGGYSQSHEANEGCMFPGYAFVLDGTNLGGASVHLQYVGMSGQAHDEAIDASKVTVNEGGTSLTLAADALENAITSTQEGATITVAVTTAGGSASFEAERMAD